MSETLKILMQADAELQAHIKYLVGNARVLIDAYWTDFTLRNAEISTLSRTGQTGQMPNNVAPVVETRGNKNSALTKVYIVWKNHSKKFRNNLNQSADHSSGKPRANASLPIHSYSTLNASAALKKSCTWNLRMALELEEKLIPLREAINGLHESHKKLQATIRKISKLTIKENNND